ncbi:hypothetical protein GCM10028797_35560 [Dyella agri]
MLPALALLCVLAYLAGLTGGFQFDDYPNIVNNSALLAIGHTSSDWLAIALSSDTTALRRPLSMLSFGLNVAWFGMSPLAFKLVNLLIHLLNVALVYAIGRRLAVHLLGSSSRHPGITARNIALLAAGLWLLHPLNVSGVLYVVQRMNELSALFTLAGLFSYTSGRERMLRDGRGLGFALGGLIGFGLLAVFSKENGVLVVAYALVIEATCYRFATPRHDQSTGLKAFFCLSVALPIALFLAYLAQHPHWLPNSYAVRDFTLYQRLLSEARILCDYLLWIFVPIPAWMGLFHDDIATSTGLFSPWTTLLSIVFLIALIAVAWKWRRSSPGLAFAVAWFLIGQSMESTILPLELVFEHRNYLPMAGLLLGVVCLLASWVPRQWPARTLGMGCAALLLGMAGLTAVRAASWGGSALSQALVEVRHHPASSRAQYEAGRAIVIDGAMKGTRAEAEQLALPYFARSAALDKHQVYPAASLVLLLASRGEVPESVIADLADRLRQTPNYVQANPFLDMLINASQQELSLSPSDMSRLVQAALANPHFIYSVRAMILNNYGAYLFNVAHDQQAAISLTAAAAAEDPRNPYFQLNLAKIALAVGQPNEATRHLALAEQLNKAGLYDRQIEEMKSHIPSAAR